MFPSVFIAEEVDGLGDMGSGDTTAVYIQILLDVFLHTSLISDSLMKLFSGKSKIPVLGAVVLMCQIFKICELYYSGLMEFFCISIDVLEFIN